jgi:hypothetical protein
LLIEVPGIPSEENVSAPILSTDNNLVIVLEGIPSDAAFGSLFVSLEQLIARYNLNWVLVAKTFDFNLAARAFDFTLKKKN